MLQETMNIETLTCLMPARQTSEVQLLKQGVAAVIISASVDFTRSPQKAVLFLWQTIENPTKYWTSLKPLV